MDLSVVSNDGIVANVSESTYVHAFTDPGGFRDVGRLFDSGKLLCDHFLIGSHESGKCTVGIRYSNQSSANLSFNLLPFIDDDH